MKLHRAGASILKGNSNLLKSGFHFYFHKAKVSNRYWDFLNLNNYSKNYAVLRVVFYASL